MMHSDKERTPPTGPVQDDQQEGLDQLENMWDEMLGRGDDDFYEAFRDHREPRAETEKIIPKQTQKRGRRR